MIKIKQLNRILLFIVLLLVLVPSQSIRSQIKELIEKDRDYILPKFPYSKTERIERIYCNMYPEIFLCENIESSERGMFPENFNLSDDFFILLSMRPTGLENFNALNIAGLYLRKKRPGRNDTTYEHLYLDIELEYLVERVYYNSDEHSAMSENEVQFRLAFVSLLEENLFLITDKIYDSELAVCNNFEGPYYETSRKFVTDILYRLLKMEKNRTVMLEIRRLILNLPENYKIQRTRRY